MNTDELTLFSAISNKNIKILSEYSKNYEKYKILFNFYEDIRKISNFLKNNKDCHKYICNSYCFCNIIDNEYFQYFQKVHEVIRAKYYFNYDLLEYCKNNNLNYNFEIICNYFDNKYKI